MDRGIGSPRIIIIVVAVPLVVDAGRAVARAGRFGAKVGRGIVVIIQMVVPLAALVLDAAAALALVKPQILVVQYQQRRREGRLGPAGQ